MDTSTLSSVSGIEAGSTSDIPSHSPDSSIVRRLEFAKKSCQTPGYRSQKDLRENVQVFLRVRPLSKPNSSNNPSLLTVLDEQAVLLKDTTSESVKEEKLTFSRIFPEDASQESVYSQTAAPLVPSLLEGHNGLIFAYGITNSGKTHTILGPESDPGILYRIVNDVFSSIDSARFEVWTSAFEIYKEKIFDLLSPRGPQDSVKELRLISKSGGQLYVKDLIEVKTENSEQARAVFRNAVTNRSVGETLLNHVSSRSHSVFSIKIHDKESGLSSKLCIVDLAGAERTKRTNEEPSVDPIAGNATPQYWKGDRFKEAAKINISLMVLGKCLKVLRKNQILSAKGYSGKLEIPPFRDSKITQIFKDFFMGFGRTVMLTTASVSLDDFKETSNALRYAAIAKDIEVSSRLDTGLKSKVHLPRSLQDEMTAAALSKLSALNSDWEDDDLASCTDDGGESIAFTDMADVDELLDEIYQLKKRLAESESQNAQIELKVRREIVAETRLQMEAMESEFMQALEAQRKQLEEKFSKKILIWKKDTLEGSAIFGKSDNSEQLIKYVGVLKEENSKLSEEVEGLVRADKQKNSEIDVKERELKDLRLIIGKNNETITSLEEKNSLLKAETEKLSDSVSKLSTEINEIQLLVNDKDSKISNYSVEIESLLTKLNESLKERNEALNRVSDLEAFNKKLNMKIEDYSAEVMRISDLYSSANESVNSSSNNVEVLQSRCQTLEAEISASNIKSNELKSIVDDLREKLAEAEVRKLELLNDMDIKLKSAESKTVEKISAYEQMCHEYQKTIKDLNEQVIDNQTASTALKLELVNLKTSSKSQEDSLVSENIRLLSQMQSSEREIIDLKTQISELSDELRTSKYLKDESDSVALKYTDNIKDLEKICTERFEEIQRLNESLEQTRSQLSESESNRQLVISEYQNFKTVVEQDISRLTAAVEAEQLKFTECKKEIQCLQQQLSSSTSESLKLQSEISDLRDQIMQANGASSRKEAELSNVSKNASEITGRMQSEVASIAAQFEAASQLLQERKNRIKDLEDELRLLKLESEGVKDSINELENCVVEKDSVLKRLEASLESADLQITKLENVVSEKIQIINDISRSLLEEREKSDDLKRDIEQKTKEHDDVSLNLQEEKNLIAKLGEDLEKKSLESSELLQKLNAEVDKSENLENEMKSKINELAQTKKKLETESSKYKKLQASLEKKSDSFEKIKKSLEESHGRIQELEELVTQKEDLIVKLNKTINEQSAFVAALNKELSEVKAVDESNVMQITKLNETLSDMEKSLEEKNAALGKMTTELSDERARVESFEDELNEVNSALKEFKKKIKEKEKELKAAEKALKLSEKSSAKLEKTISKLEEDRASISTQLCELQVETQSQIDKLTNELEKSKSKVVELEEEIKKAELAKAQLSEQMNEMSESFESNISDVISQKKDLSSMMKALGSERDTFANSLQQSETRVFELEEKISALGLELENLRGVNNDLSNQVMILQSIEKHLQQKDKQIHDLEEAIIQSKANSEALLGHSEDQLERAMKENERLHVMNQTLRAQLNEIMEGIEKKLGCVAPEQENQEPSDIENVQMNSVEDTGELMPDAVEIPECLQGDNAFEDGLHEAVAPDFSVDSLEESKTGDVFDETESVNGLGDTGNLSLVTRGSRRGKNLLRLNKNSAHGVKQRLGKVKEPVRSSRRSDFHEAAAACSDGGESVSSVREEQEQFKLVKQASSPKLASTASFRGGHGSPIAEWNRTVNTTDWLSLLDEPTGSIRSQADMDSSQFGRTRAISRKAQAKSGKPESTESGLNETRGSSTTRKIFNPYAKRLRSRR